jgi:hypothetical protein
MGFGAPESSFGSGRPILNFSTNFLCDACADVYPKANYFSASKCLRGHACFPIPR